MQKITKVLVGLTGTGELDQLILESAIQQALNADAKLVIACILDEENLNIYQVLSEDYIKPQQEKLEAALEQYRKVALNHGVSDVELVFDQGNPAKIIVEVIVPRTKADLLVIGAKNQKGIHKHIGSQAQYMAKYSPISTYIVHA